jgi:hypothetical protein
MADPPLERVWCGFSEKERRVAAIGGVEEGTDFE